MLKNRCSEKKYPKFLYTQKKHVLLKNEKMVNRKLGNLGNLGISEILFRVLSCPSFQFCSIVKTENLDLKNLGKNFLDF